MLYTWIVTSGEESYDGVPVVELPINDVDVPALTHLRRSLRHAGEADIDPAWAIEAALDQRALIARDPASRPGEAIRVVGFSPGEPHGCSSWSCCPKVIPRRVVGMWSLPGRPTVDYETPTPPVMRKETGHDQFQPPASGKDRC